MSIEAYPLHWPSHRPRTPAGNRKRAAFHSTKSEWHSRTDGTSYRSTQTQRVTISVGRQRLVQEISSFTRAGQNWIINPATVIVSSNVPTRGDGMPYSNAREPDDPAVAVYFRMKGQQHCLTCDKWDRVADNLNAIAKHVEAMRGQLRWGVADVAAMFAGFKALPGAIITPEAMSVEQAAAFLAKHSRHTPKSILEDPEFAREAYRSAAATFHPDRAGSELPEWHMLQRAREALKLHQEEGAAV